MKPSSSPLSSRADNPSSEIRTAAPAPLPHRTGMVSDMMAAFQQQCKNILCDRIGSIGGDVANRDTPFGRRRGIHDVVAGGKHSDVADGQAGRENLFIDHRFVGDNNFSIPNPFCRLLRPVRSYTESSPNASKPAQLKSPGFSVYPSSITIFMRFCPFSARRPPGAL